MQFKALTASLNYHKNIYAMTVKTPNQQGLQQEHTFDNHIFNIRPACIKRNRKFLNTRVNQANFLRHKPVNGNLEHKFYEVKIASGTSNKSTASATGSTASGWRYF
ncbi:hypothetical protein LROSRS0_p10060 (plasmid) [Furfurilactobacillus rossiae]|nr:hypothetical protein LROSRS0_p10060 [Furfurilactobacillus rossiae]